MDIASLIPKALGTEKADLVIRNARLVNTLSGEIEETSLAIADGRILGTGDYDAEQVIDAGGRYVCPSLIDGHIHIESSLLSVPEFARAVAAHGTGAVVCDPHELANVVGLAGLQYVLDSSASLPVGIYPTVPSCVPATHLETSGAELTAEDIAGALAANPERVAGLGEMMNFPGVLMGLPPVLAKLEAATGRVIDGHAPLVTGKDLNAYILAGPSSDHESTQLKEGREKLGKGMHLMLRAGTHEKNMPDLLPAVTDANWPQCSFVSDDRHVVDIVDNGHLDATVRQAIGLGMDPVRAVQLASLTTARHYGMHDRGALAPGYRADFFLVEDLRDFRAGDCYLGGRDIRDLDFSSRVRPPTNTMDVKSLDPGMFAIPAHTGEVRVIGIVPGQIVTENLVMAPTISAGQVVADPDRDLAKLAVIERHHGSGAVGLGLVRGLGLQHGALAGTVAHDSHNLIVAGTSDEDMLVAARRAVEMGGGFVLVADGRVVADMPLPIAGLMSDAGVQEAAAQARALTRALPALGSAVAPEPFMILSFLALPVIPSLKLTDKGLVDVGRFDLVDLWVS